MSRNKEESSQQNSVPTISLWKRRDEMTPTHLTEYEGPLDIESLMDPQLLADIGFTKEQSQDKTQKRIKKSSAGQKSLKPPLSKLPSSTGTQLSIQPTTVSAKPQLKPIPSAPGKVMGVKGQPAPLLTERVMSSRMREMLLPQDSARESPDINHYQSENSQSPQINSENDPPQQASQVYSDMDKAVAKYKEILARKAAAIGLSLTPNNEEDNDDIEDEKMEVVENPRLRFEETFPVTDDEQRPKHRAQSPLSYSRMLKSEGPIQVSGHGVSQKRLRDEMFSPRGRGKALNIEVVSDNTGFIDAPGSLRTKRFQSIFRIADIDGMNEPPLIVTPLRPSTTVNEASHMPVEEPEIRVDHHLVMDYNEFLQVAGADEKNLEILGKAIVPENWSAAPNRMMWPIRFPNRDKAFDESSYFGGGGDGSWKPGSAIETSRAPSEMRRPDSAKRSRSISLPPIRKSNPEGIRLVHLRVKTEKPKFKSSTILDRLGLTEELESWLVSGKPFQRTRSDGKLANLTGEPNEASRETIFSAEDFDEFIAHPFIVDARNKPLGYFTPTESENSEESESESSVSVFSETDLVQETGYVGNLAASPTLSTKMSRKSLQTSTSHDPDASASSKGGSGENVENEVVHEKPISRRARKNDSGGSTRSKRKSKSRQRSPKFTEENGDATQNDENGDFMDFENYVSEYQQAGEEEDNGEDDAMLDHTNSSEVTLEKEKRLDFNTNLSSKSHVASSSSKPDGQQSEQLPIAPKLDDLFVNTYDRPSTSDSEKNHDVIQAEHMNNSLKLFQDKKFQLISKPRDEENGVKERPFTAIIRRIQNVPWTKPEDEFIYPLISRAPPGLDVVREIFKIESTVYDPDSLPPADQRKLAVLYAFKGQFDISRHKLNISIKETTPKPETYWISHQLHVQRGEVQKAVNELRKLTDIQANHFGAHVMKARLLVQTEDYKEALESYKVALRIHENDSKIFAERAEIYEKLEEPFMAHQDYSMAVHLDAGNLKALKKMADYHYERKNWIDVLTLNDMILEKESDYAIGYMQRGHALAYVRNWKFALDDLNQAVLLDPSNHRLFILRGVILMDYKIEKSIEELSKSIMINNTLENIDAYFYRALCYEKKNRFDLALQDYLAATRIDEANLKAHMKIALIYKHKFKQRERAVAQLNLAIKSNPTALHPYIHRAKLLTEMHDKLGSALKASTSKKPAVTRSTIDAAIQDYTRAIHMYPTKIGLYLSRGRLYVEKNLWELAEYDFECAYELTDPESQNFLQRAGVQLMQSEYEKVINEFVELQLKRKPISPQALVVVARSYLMAGHARKALNELDELLDNIEGNPEPAALITRAECVAALGYLDMAIEDLTEALETDPRNAKARFLRGYYRLRVNDPNGTNDLSRAIKYDPRRYDYYAARAIHYFKTEQYDACLADCTSALELQPNSVQLLILRASLNHKLGGLNEALSDLTEAIFNDPACTPALVTRALIYHELGKNYQALQDYGAALLIMPENGQLYKNRGHLCWQLGQYEAAVADFRQAKKYFPEDLELARFLARAFTIIGKFEKSVVAYDDANARSPLGVDPLLARANMYSGCGMFEKARADYCRIIHMSPRHADAYLNIALTYQMEKKFASAWKAFNAALKVNPYLATAYQGRAILCMITNNQDQAVKDMTEAIRIDPENPELLTNRGVVFQTTGDNFRALDDFKHAVSIDPKFSLAHFNMGNLYLKYNQLDFAETSFTKALEGKPDDHMSFLNRAITRSLMKNFSGAEEDFRLALQGNAHPFVVYLNRAKFLASQTRYKEALHDFYEAIKLDTSNNESLKVMAVQCKMMMTDDELTVDGGLENRKSAVRGILENYVQNLEVIN